MHSLERSPVFALPAVFALSALPLLLFAVVSCAPASPPASLATAPAATASPTPLATAPAPAASPTPSVAPTPAATSTPLPVTRWRYQFANRSVQVSVDGQNWQDRPYRFEDQIAGLLPAVANPDVVYVLTTAPLTTTEPFRPRLRYTLYASADAAQTWERRAADEIGGCYMVKVALQPVSGWTVPPDMLTVRTQCADSPSDSRGLGLGARLSTDGGRTFVWTMAADGIELLVTPEGILRFIPDRSGGSTLALSRDKGLTWQALTPPALNVGYPSSSPLFEADEHDPLHVQLRERAGEQRVWESFDGGHTWTVR